MGRTSGRNQNSSESSRVSSVHQGNKSHCEWTKNELWGKEVTVRERKSYCEGTQKSLERNAKFIVRERNTKVIVRENKSVAWDWINIVREHRTIVRERKSAIHKHLPPWPFLRLSVLTGALFILHSCVPTHIWSSLRVGEFVWGSPPTSQTWTCLGQSSLQIFTTEFTEALKAQGGVCVWLPPLKIYPWCLGGAESRGLLPHSNLE